MRSAIPSAVTPVPKRLLSFDNQTIDTSGDKWRVRASEDGGKYLVMTWSSLDNDLSPHALGSRAKEILKLYVGHRLQVVKGCTAWNDYCMFRTLFRWLAKTDEMEGLQTFEWSRLDISVFRSFLSFGMSRCEKGLDFSRLRAFYVWGALTGRFSDFDEHLAISLQEVRAQGAVRGAAVRFRHPTKGPFSGPELQVILAALARNAGSAKNRAAVMLHLELGPNPQAVVRLKREDLKKFELRTVEGGLSRVHTRYQLDLPRVKKRNPTRQTATRPISNSLGSLLESLQTTTSGPYLFHWLQERKPETALFHALREFAEEAGLISPETAERLSLSPRRFRYTLATEMAREGASPEKIAAILDHTDLQSVDVYVETSSYVVDQLGKKFDEVLKPVVNGFKGVVLKHEQPTCSSSRTEPTIPGQSFQFPLLQIDVGGIGLCGRDVRQDGLCRLAPPLTCYPCEFFAAFRDGPHKQILAALERTRTELESTSDKRISMQLDGVVSALKDLLAQIESDRGPTH